jgi:hypothetical protein
VLLVKAETLREARRADRISERTRAVVSGVQERAAAEAKIAKAVAGLRRDRVGWPTIADALGVSRQAARKRYGQPKLPPENDPTEQPLFDL